MIGPKRFKPREVERIKIRAEHLESDFISLEREVEGELTRFNQRVAGFSDQLRKVISDYCLERFLRVNISETKPLSLSPHFTVDVIRSVRSPTPVEFVIPTQVAAMLDEIIFAYQSAYIEWFRGPIEELAERQESTYKPLLDLTMVHTPSGYDPDRNYAFVLFDDRAHDDISYFTVDIERDDIDDMDVLPDFPKRVFLQAGFRHCSKLINKFTIAKDERGVNAYVVDTPCREVSADLLMQTVKDGLVDIYGRAHPESAKRILEQRLGLETQRLSRLAAFERNIHEHAVRFADELMGTPQQVLYAGTDFSDQYLEALARSASKINS